VETVREIGSSLPAEARNVFLRTPEGLETPHFRLLHEGEGVRAWHWHCLRFIGRACKLSRRVSKKEPLPLPLVDGLAHDISSDLTWK
jgi:hypothetical protein